MRFFKEPQPQLGEIPIEQVALDHLDSRDDIPRVLKGIQDIYCNQALRQEIRKLMEEHFQRTCDQRFGRPGMDLWKILVFAIFKLGIGCDYDRLENMANWHQLLRQILGHGDWSSKERYDRSTLIRNVNLLTPELIDRINELIVKHGHRLAGHEERMPLKARCDSFVVETDVHYPTDINLLYDCTRVLIRDTSRQCKKRHLPGWRQSGHLEESVDKLFQSIRTSQRAQRRPDRVRAYLKKCDEIIERATESWEELKAKQVKEKKYQKIQRFLRFGKQLSGQVERRVLKGEKIPASEKIFSVFEPHTRWIQKGKSGKPVELGVPVCIVEDQHQFILKYRPMWNEQDVEVAVPLIQETKERFPGLYSCSFDKGFHSPGNQKQLREVISEVTLPKKGKCSKQERERETAESFKAARKQHPAIESAINHLEHRGLNRVHSYGKEGFERTVALAVLAANLCRIGSIVRAQELQRLTRPSVHREAA